MRGKRQLQVSVPDHFRCPISLDLMKDPVTLSTGITYDRHSIETWLDAGNYVCPLTNQVLHSQDSIPNHTLRRLIQDWCVANRGSGIDRIPTPTVPLSSAEVGDILLEVSSGRRTVEALKKLRALAKESERCRKCIASTNAAYVAASVFCEHSLKALQKSQPSVDVCNEALGMLPMILPMNDDARELLASFNALRCITSTLLQGNPEGKTNAALVLREMAGDNQYRERIGATDGLAEGLVRLLKEPLCPRATKASITAIYHIACGCARVREELVEAGVVPLLLEILPEADLSICERSLAALDVLCDCPEGRSAAHEHALTIPVIVKKIMGVSVLATELAVSILWAICRHSSDDSVLFDALQAGAFQKLVVLVQLGCKETERKRAIELLKLLNKHRGEWECIDSMDFKEVKRSF
eukprot:Gb_27794 [translate_table: standard]